ncbi:MAG: hypothetical protein WC501_01595 [Candidatus Micrarchaeia archaeon]
MKKGIYFSFDALIASSIFILAIISFLSYWHSLKETMISEDSFSMEEAIRISNSFFLYSDTGFGFATSLTNKKINLTKIENFKNSRSADQILKEELSTPYDIYIVINLHEADLDHAQYIENSKYNLGEEIPADAKFVSKFTRIAPAFDGSMEYLAVVSFYIYK